LVKCKRGDHPYCKFALHVVTVTGGRKGGGGKVKRLNLVRMVPVLWHLFHADF